MRRFNRVFKISSTMNWWLNYTKIKWKEISCLFFVSLELTHLLLHGSECFNQANRKAEMKEKQGGWSFQSYCPYKRSKQRGLHAGNINLLGN